MDLLLNLMTSAISNQQQAEWAVLGLIALVVFILIATLILFLNNLFDPVKARFLNDSRDDFVASTGAGNTTQKLQAYSHILLPSDEELTSRTVQRLNYAGYHAKKYLLQYFAAANVPVLGIEPAGNANSFIVPSAGLIRPRRLPHCPAHQIDPSGASTGSRER